MRRGPGHCGDYEAPAGITPYLLPVAPGRKLMTNVFDRENTTESECEAVTGEGRGQDSLLLVRGNFGTLAIDNRPPSSA